MKILNLQAKKPKKTQEINEENKSIIEIDNVIQQDLLEDIEN